MNRNLLLSWARSIQSTPPTLYFKDPVCRLIHTGLESLQPRFLYSNIFAGCMYFHCVLSLHGVFNGHSASQQIPVRDTWRFITLLTGSHHLNPLWVWWIWSTSYFFYTQFNIFLPSIRRSCMWVSPFSFLTGIFLHPSHHLTFQQQSRYLRSSNREE